jgi:hypothetical protein
MSLRWGADDDTLSRGMSSEDRELSAKEGVQTREDLDKWDKDQRRRAVARSRSKESAGKEANKAVMSKVYVDAAHNMASAITSAAGGMSAKGRHSTVVGQQAGTAAKQANVAGKLEAAQAGEGSFGGKGLFGNREANLLARQERLAARQTKLGEQRLGMEEKNPYLTTKYRY